MDSIYLHWLENIVCSALLCCAVQIRAYGIVSASHILSRILNLSVSYLFAARSISLQWMWIWHCDCDCYGDGQSLQLMGATNTVVRDITSINSRQFHVTIAASNNVLAEGLTIRAPADSPNTDGIHISASNVTIRNSNIGTGGSTNLF